MTKNAALHTTWRNKSTFMLAAVGSAVGLGNIWKFPYIAGENGGGAFVLVYLLCLAAVGLPIMIAEIALGRRAKANPIHAMAKLARDSDASSKWALIAFMGVLCAILTLSFYSVIAGWSLDYIWQTATGQLTNISGPEASFAFDVMTDEPIRLTLWHSLFMAITVSITAFGIHKGIETAFRIIMPLLFILMIFLVGYSAYATDHFIEGLQFLFRPNFSLLSWEGILYALGHAFFTLTIGMCVIMTFGAYMPKELPIAKTAFFVILMDTLVALMAGMTIFPLVFANDLVPNQGPGLLFISMPTAFGNMIGGQLVGVLFFIMIALAALSSAISLLEPPVAWLCERFDYNRVTLTLLTGFIVWILGIGSVLSFNVWSDENYQFFGKTIFQLLDFVTANIMMPLGGLMIAIFAGWVVKRSFIYKELGLSSFKFNVWRAFCRVIAPICVLIIMLVNLIW